MTPVVFHPEAELELDSAVAYYENRRRGLGLELEREVFRATDAIREAPGRWTVHKGDVRKYALHRFPFTVFFLVIDDTVWIVAVAHAARRPGYWKKRLR